MTPENAIFLCYRRKDAEGETFRIYERLKVSFGTEAVFIDQFDFLGGDDWRDKTSALLQNARVVVVIIGKEWPRIWIERQRDENDPVRRELQLAIENPDCIVIPVTLEERGSHPDLDALPTCVDDPHLKQLLAKLLAMTSMHVRRGRDFEHDLQDLIRRLDDVPMVDQLRPVTRGRVPLMTTLMALGLVIVAATAMWRFRPSKSAPSAGPQPPSAANGISESEVPAAPPEKASADAPRQPAVPNPNWRQVNLKLVAAEAPEIRESLPEFLVRQIIDGPFAFSGKEDSLKIDEIRRTNGADNLPRELLFACEIVEQFESVARLSFQNVEGVALLCEWCPAQGDAQSLRNKRVLFPEDLNQQSYQEYEFPIPMDGGRTHGWVVVWAFPLEPEGLVQLGGDAGFQPSNDTTLLLNASPPWRLSVKLKGAEG